MKKIFLPPVLALLCGLHGFAFAATDTELEAHFQSPPASARPWVFWVWLRADSTPEAITKDLEEMKAKGIEGAILYDTGRIEIKPLATWSPRANELVRHACKEAGRLGVKLVVSIGLANTSGKIGPEYGLQKLLCSRTSLTGPQRFDGILPTPDTNVPAQVAFAPTPVGEGGVFTGHEIAVLAVPDREGVAPTHIINISSKMDAKGRLQWDAPAGKWKILRFGYAPTGKQNVRGIYTDGMSAEALDKTWDVTIAPLLKSMSPEERKGICGIEDDSWEAGGATWTGLFPKQFKELRGYDLIPWLPALAGEKMGGKGDVAGVRRDYFRTIADLIAKNHYGRLTELANKNGLVSYAEAAGPHATGSDLMKYCAQVDVPMAEFWAPSAHRPTPAERFLLRVTASANHIYGKTVTPCESLTSVGPFWEESLFDLKATADQGFTEGCNLLVIHNFSHPHSATAMPGYAYTAGTLYGRTTTWWEQTPAFNTYLGRCSHLLQQGHFVADALYFRGDGAGKQMKPKPALPADGYDYDDCNLDVLLNRLAVKDGRLTFPDGMSYRMLVLPGTSAIEPSALEKIAKLVGEGAVVVGPRPAGPAGLVTAEQRKAFDATASRLWPKIDGDHAIGAGRVVADKSPGEVLLAMNVPPDFENKGTTAAGVIDWIHRRAGETEIYFVASRLEPKENVECTFRVSGRQPELWDPVTGRIRKATAFTQSNGRTTVPIEFDPCGSVFVIFRSPIGQAESGKSDSNYPLIAPLAVMSGPWEVSFDPKWGGPEKAMFDTLTDWTKRPEEGIKYYSGTAVYKKTFNLSAPPANGGRILLNLGEVHEVASVKLNGKDLGVVWTKPARVDITDAVKAGDNNIEITVVNLWPNRLIGDDSLPPEKRLTETNIKKFTSATPLYPSGLLGPVELESSR